MLRHLQHMQSCDVNARMAESQLTIQRHNGLQWLTDDMNDHA